MNTNTHAIDNFITNTDIEFVKKNIYAYRSIQPSRFFIWQKTPEDMNDYIIPDPDIDNCYCDFKLNDIKYNYPYESIHPLSYGATYFVLNVLRGHANYNKTNKESNIHIKIQFCPGGHIVIIPLKTFLSRRIFYPYYPGIFGYCSFGNLQAKDFDINNNLYKLWLELIGRAYNPMNDLYCVFGARRYVVADPTFRCFENFINFNQLLKDSRMVPLVDVNDPMLYSKLYPLTPTDNMKFSVRESRDMALLPVNGFNNVNLPMRIKQLPFMERRMSELKRLGRPRGTKNKPKPEPEKIQMYKLIDNTKD